MKRSWAMFWLLMVTTMRLVQSFDMMEKRNCTHQTTTLNPTDSRTIEPNHTVVMETVEIISTETIKADQTPPNISESLVPLDHQEQLEGNLTTDSTPDTQLITQQEEHNSTRRETDQNANDPQTETAPQVPSTPDSDQLLQTLFKNNLSFDSTNVAISNDTFEKVESNFNQEVEFASQTTQLPLEIELQVTDTKNEEDDIGRLSSLRSLVLLITNLEKLKEKLKGYRNDFTIENNSSLGNVKETIEDDSIEADVMNTSKEPEIALKTEAETKVQYDTVKSTEPEQGSQIKSTYTDLKLEIPFQSLDKGNSKEFHQKYYVSNEGPEAEPAATVLDVVIPDKSFIAPHRHHTKRKAKLCAHHFTVAHKKSLHLGQPNKNS